jgi:photosystem II stability/assembly factor-like uncharacterized protein
MLRLSAFLAIAGLGASLFAAAPAEANGRFPAAGQIVVDPADPSHLLVRATYGLLTTRDGGASWDWICEQAVGYGDTLDPPVAITADGSVIAGVFDGLSVTHGDSCGWKLVGGELESKFFIDVSTERETPAASVAFSSNGLGNNAFQTRLWESPDNAVTWTQAGADLPADFLGLTVDVAPSDPTRVYASGLAAIGGGEYVGALERSMDRGQTWERFPVPGSNAGTGPYIAAIDPAMPDRVYLRLDGEPGKLLVSEDAGETWDEAFVGQGKLKGFALSPDGATVLVGGIKDGVWRASATALTFEKVSEVAVECLAWAGAGVYACASEFMDGFTIGLSTDEGATFEPIHHLPCLRGPLECDPASEVGAVCPSQWPVVAATLNQASCYGAGGAGGSSSGGGSPPPTSMASGGGCQATPAGGGMAAAFGLCFAALMLRTIRRRRGL